MAKKARKSNAVEAVVGHFKAKKRVAEAAKKKAKKKVKTKSKDYEVGDKKPPKQYQFKKGQSGNPLGAQLHDPVKRALKKITKESYQEIIEVALTGTPQDLIEKILDPDTTVIEKILIEALLKASESGNIDKLEQVLERVIGKVPNDITSGGKPLKSGGASAVIIVPANGKTKQENQK